MEELNIGAIIQARMNSTRFPGKIKEKFGETSLLETCIKSIKISKSVRKIIIATTENSEDDWIESLNDEKNNIFVFRGDENDVLSRYMHAINKFNLDIVVRITADDPFKPPWLMDKLVKIIISDQYDYASNTIDPSYPEGLDIEVFTKKAITKASKYGKKISEREHVTPYIWKNPKIFKCYSEKIKNNLSWARLTIDYKEDLERLRNIWIYLGEAVYKKEFLKRFLVDNYLINLSKSEKIRNEGYYKTLKEDKN
mgnify:CR=1 FL=1